MIRRFRDRIFRYAGPVYGFTISVGIGFVLYATWMIH